MKIEKSNPFSQLTGAEKFATKGLSFMIAGRFILLYENR
tara:strand:+ start:195 stop:311 length:117 start_codon:yes stop_codon:yes gene_type:complete